MDVFGLGFRRLSKPRSMLTDCVERSIDLGVEQKLDELVRMPSFDTEPI